MYLDDVLCDKITFKSGTNPYKIECGARLARNLTIVGGYEDGFLHICEVEVWSTRPPGVMNQMIDTESACSR